MFQMRETGGDILSEVVHSVKRTGSQQCKTKIAPGHHQRSDSHHSEFLGNTSDGIFVFLLRSLCFAQNKQHHLGVPHDILFVGTAAPTPSF